VTQQLVRDLDEGGHLYEKEIMVAYDPSTTSSSRTGTSGTCPYCGAHARGDECDEGCQRHLEPGEVEDPESTITGNPPSTASAPTSSSKSPRSPSTSPASSIGWRGPRTPGTSPASGSSRGSKTGVSPATWTGDRLPRRNPQDLVLYVWVDAPIEYISSTKQYTERVGADAFDWEAAWKEGASDAHPEGGEIVHVIGRDIIQHHTIFWPAMLEATDHTEPRAP